MPIHRFKCRKCETITEEIVPLGNLDNFICPKCGNVTDRLMSAASSNFHAWSDTQDKLAKDALTPMSHLPKAEYNRSEV